VSGEPMPNESVQWKQSIERPNRGWDYDGKRILGHVGYDIYLWDATTGDVLHKMKGHKERIQAVQFSPDGEHAISSSWISPGPMVMRKSKDTRTILWTLATGRTKQIFPGQVAGEFSPDGKRILTFSQRPDESSFDAAIWESLTGRELVKLKLDEHSGPYWDTLHFSPDGRHIVHVGNGAYLLYNSSKAVLYSASDGREIGRAAAKHGIHRYTSNGASASFDSERASRIEIESGRTIQSIEHGLKASWRGAWTHDGSKVAAFPADGEIKIWDLGSGKTITGAKIGPYPQRSAIISPDNSRLAVEWGGGNVEGRDVDPGMGIYDMKTGEEIVRIKLAEWGHLLGFSPDSKTLLVGGSEFVIYNSENGEKIRALKLLDDVSFSHNRND
jgi:hypothetical protein